MSKYSSNTLYHSAVYCARKLAKDGGGIVALPASVLRPKWIGGLPVTEDGASIDFVRSDGVCVPANAFKVTLFGVLGFGLPLTDLPSDAQDFYEAIDTSNVPPTYEQPDFVGSRKVETPSLVSKVGRVNFSVWRVSNLEGEEIDKQGLCELATNEISFFNVSDRATRNGKLITGKARVGFNRDVVRRWLLSNYAEDRFHQSETAKSVFICPLPTTTAQRIVCLLPDPQESKIDQQPPYTKSAKMVKTSKDGKNLRLLCSDGTLRPLTSADWMHVLAWKLGQKTVIVKSRGNGVFLIDTNAPSSMGDVPLDSGASNRRIPGRAGRPVAKKNKITMSVQHLTWLLSMLAHCSPPSMPSLITAFNAYNAYVRSHHPRGREENDHQSSQLKTATNVPRLQEESSNPKKRRFERRLGLQRSSGAMNARPKKSLEFSPTWIASTPVRLCSQCLLHSKWPEPRSRSP